LTIQLGLGGITGVLGGYMQGQHEVAVKIWGKDVGHTKSVKNLNRTTESIKIE